MKRENIERMISDVDENFVKEAIGDGRERGSRGRGRGIRVEKWAAAAAVCAVVLGTGITVTAAASDTFRGWLTGIFGGREITEVDIDPVKAPVVDGAADLPADQNDHLSLGEDMEICGETESFVCQYHIEEEETVVDGQRLTGEEMIVDKLYSIQDDGLRELETEQFHGTYDGVGFSFEYAVVNNEIFGCNLKGDINSVFHYTDGGTAYVQLSEKTEDVFTKACIARLNLKTGEVEKLTGDGAIGGMMMSPNGKVILINYRMDGYWSVFDIASRTEKKVEEIDGYARAHQIVFQDDYHVLTLGDSYKEKGKTMTGTKVIDLRTGRRTASYKKCGDYHPEWLYEKEGDRLLVKRVDGTTFIQIDGVGEIPHAISYRGDYVLLKNLEDEKAPYYLCNLREKTYMKIVPPSALSGDVGIYLAAKEDKILLTDGKDAYLVDIRNLG